MRALVLLLLAARAFSTVASAGSDGGGGGIGRGAVIAGLVIVHSAVQTAAQPAPPPPPDGYVRVSVHVTDPANLVALGKLLVFRSDCDGGSVDWSGTAEPNRCGNAALPPTDGAGDASR